MSANEQQAEHWNSDEAEHWVEHADRYDGQLAPFAEAILDAAEISGTARVLDVGCGCGSTTLAAARRAQSVLGVDLSRSMLAVARERATAQNLDNVSFEVGDAQTHDFPSVDRIISRFGVMFFDDPVKAFTNLRHALVDGGRMVFACWQPLTANDWLLLPGIAAAAHVPLPDLGGDPNAPGMFSLADADRIRSLLSGAGFGTVDVAAFTPTIRMGGTGTLDEAMEFLLGTGVARTLLGDAEPDARERALAAVRDVLAEHYVEGVGVEFGSAAWVVTAAAD